MSLFRAFFETRYRERRVIRRRKRIKIRRRKQTRSRANLFDGSFCIEAGNFHATKTIRGVEESIGWNSLLLRGYWTYLPTYLPTCFESIRTRYSSSFRTNLPPLSSFRALIRQIQINEEKEHRRLRNLIDSTSHRRGTRASQSRKFPFREHQLDTCEEMSVKMSEEERRKKERRRVKILCLSKRRRRRKIVKINRAGRYFLATCFSEGEGKISGPSPTVVNRSTRIIY